MEALRKNFERKYGRWVNGERKMIALADGRTKRLGKAPGGLASRGQGQADCKRRLWNWWQGEPGMAGVRPK